MKVIRATIFIFFYVSSAALIYYIHVQYFTVDVVFYSALFDVAIAAVLTAVVIVYFSFFNIFNWFEKNLLVCVGILIGYSLAISVPTVIDRSLSFYLLEKLQQNGGEIDLEKFSYIFSNEFMREHRLVDVRLTEQEASGTIIIREDCVILTEKGQILANFGQFFRRNLLPKRRLLRGEYSADLTDIFSKKNDSRVDYSCK